MRKIEPSIVYCLLLGLFVVGAVGAFEPQLATADDSPQPKPQTENGKNPHVWQPRTRSVAVFKNGMGFFMREGDVKLRDGWCVAKQIPPAAFGTLAIYSHDEKQSVDIVGSGPGELVEFDGRHQYIAPQNRKRD